MQIDRLHDWKVTPSEGRELQERLRRRVELRPLPGRVRLVAGADMSFSRERGVFFGAVVLLSFPELQVVEEVSARHKPTFPYVPGLLSFREGPVLLRAFEKLKRTPDVVIFDGQGQAHPRRLGLASHLGLWLKIPSIGCAKSRLIGEYRMPAEAKGRASTLRDEGQQIGVVLRTREAVKPLFVSPGHLADFETSTRLVLECCTRYRLPEPTRLADIAVGRIKREYLSAQNEPLR